MIDLNFLLIIIGQIATWLTILLVYFTLREMRNQRKASQKPDLILPRVSVYGYAHGDKDKSSFLTPRFWSNKVNVNLITGDVWEEEAPAKFYNVGFGVAKNIELIWRVDYAKTIQQIKDYCYQNSVPIVLQLNEEDRRLTIVERGVTTADDLPVFSMKENFDFLMPVSVTKEGLSTYPPLAVKELISTIVYLKIHARRKNPDSKLEFDVPYMKIELHYDDLEDSRYSKTFDVIFSIRYFWTRPFEKTEPELKQLWGGAFEFKIIN